MADDGVDLHAGSAVRRERRTRHPTLRGARDRGPRRGPRGRAGDAALGCRGWPAARARSGRVAAAAEGGAGARLIAWYGGRAAPAPAAAAPPRPAPPAPPRPGAGPAPGGLPYGTAAPAWLSALGPPQRLVLAVLIASYAAIYVTVTMIKYRFYLYTDFDLPLFTQAADLLRHGSPWKTGRGVGWRAGPPALSL